jgi:3-hydroxyisobutyrate dehydrogenase-like beta-hydroxyacid dehydrogenase
MRIGYLGVGNMGQPMAGKLLDAGHELWVYDVREDAMRPLLERQARRAASPKALVFSHGTVTVITGSGSGMGQASVSPRDDFR